MAWFMQISDFGWKTAANVFHSGICIISRQQASWKILQPPYDVISKEAQEKFYDRHPQHSALARKIFLLILI